MTIDEWLKQASDELKNTGTDSAQLDAELILAHTIRQSRTYLHAHGDDVLSARHEDIADARLELRLERTPIAYIIGHKEFYGRRFKTTPAALIPRPESEAMIELIGTIIPKNLPLLPTRLRLVDVGTGTGCLGITAKLEWPELDVTLVDISNHALQLAKENAELLHADVRILKNDLLRGYGLTTDIVLANLPYVDRSWVVSPDTAAEPDLALYADNGGLALINNLIEQAETIIPHSGHMILECDPRQQLGVIDYAKQHSFRHVTTSDYAVLLQRV